MEILDKISEIKNEITKKLVLLELDSRFSDLVNILKRKEIQIEQAFLSEQNKEERDWHRYYAKLCLFLKQDIAIVLKMYYHHKDDELSIYDDSSKEINQELLLKEQEIKKCIQETASSYHDDVLTNYIKTKFELIMAKYQSDLNDILKRNEVSLKNNLTDNYKDIMPLTIYNNCTMVKERYLDELNNELTDFINYVNSLIENKRMIQEKELLIKNMIKELGNQELTKQFTKIIDNYYESLKNVGSIDIKIGKLQKDYFKELDTFYNQVLVAKEEYELKINEQCYFDYLNKMDIYRIEFSKLQEIKEYLQEHYNYELASLLIDIYYQIIKLEVNYHDGESVLYQQLDKRSKLSLEKKFISDLKGNELLIANQELMEKFLTTKFDLKLLTTYVKLTMTEEISDVINEYKTELLATNVDKNSSLEEVDYVCHSYADVFDDNGEALIRRGLFGSFYVVNRNGLVKKVAVYCNNNCIQDYQRLNYHDGVIVYNYYTLFVDNPSSKFFIADSDKVIGDNLCASLEWFEEHNHYSDGLIKVKRENNKNSYFIDKAGKVKLVVRNRQHVDSRFSDGYLVTVRKFDFGDDMVEYLDKNGKVCYKVKCNQFLNIISGDSRAFRFVNGLAVIKEDTFSDVIFLNTNFEQVLQDYEYHIIKNIVVSSGPNYNIWCLKSKNDGQTYIYENDKLIPMSEEEILNRELVENYALIRDTNGELKFVLKDQVFVDSLLDIIRKKYRSGEYITKMNDDVKRVRKRRCPTWYTDWIPVDDEE